jgi:hypothetical protein
MDSNYDFEGAGEFIYDQFKHVIARLIKGVPAKALHVFIDERYKHDTDQLTNMEEVSNFIGHVELFADGWVLDRSSQAHSQQETDVLEVYRFELRGYRARGTSFEYAGSYHAKELATCVKAVGHQLLR